MILAGGNQDVDEVVASVGLAAAGRSEAVGPSAEPRIWLALSGTMPRASDYWETLTYVVIWLCGWIGIGLCFL